jgi:hypothetical protein
MLSMDDLFRVCAPSILPQTNLKHLYRPAYEKSFVAAGLAAEHYFCALVVRPHTLDKPA